MTQQQELAWACRLLRLKLSTHNQAPFSKAQLAISVELFGCFMHSVFSNIRTAARSGLPLVQWLAAELRQQQQEEGEESEGRVWLTEQELACSNGRAANTQVLCPELALHHLLSDPPRARPLPIAAA